jgi:hypothetical protein
MSNETEPRPPVQQGTNSALALLVDSGSIHRVRHSFNPETPRGFELLIKGMQGEQKDLSEEANKDLLVTDYLIHPASSIDDETGEVKDFDRVVVYTKDGNVYSCGSLGVKKSIALMAMARGTATWDPPIACKVRTTKTSGKKNWMELVIDIPAMTKHLSGREVAAPTSPTHIGVCIWQSTLFGTRRGNSQLHTTTCPKRIPTLRLLTQVPR